ncbi:MAG: hypothetical protein ACEY3M_00235 [Wolbachia sp.]
MKSISEFIIVIDDQKLTADAKFTEKSIDYLVNIHRPKFDSECCWSHDKDYYKQYRDDNDPYVENMHKVRERLCKDKIFICSDFTKSDILKIKKYNNSTIQIFISPNNKKHCVAKFGSKTITLQNKKEKSLICWVFERAFSALNFHRL